MKKNILFLFIGIPSILLSFDVTFGLMKEKYIVSVKKLPVHQEKNALSNKITVLFYGDEVILNKEQNSAIIKLDNNNTVKKEAWLNISPNNDSSIKGYVPKSALVSDSVMDNFLQSTSENLGKTDRSIDNFSKNKNTTMISNTKNGKGFSEEEKIKRKVKKGFTNKEEIKENKSTKPNKKTLISLLEVEKSSSQDLQEFRKQGNLR